MKVRCLETGIDRGLKQGAGNDAVFHTQVFPGVARRLRFGPVKSKERKPDLILFFSIPLTEYFPFGIVVPQSE